LAAKGEGYLGMFRGFGPGVAAALEGTEIVMPDEVYDGASKTIDLGGRIVELSTYGLAHTKGDQVVSVPDAGVVFVGDLAEERIFPIFPWFPPDDADIDADNWARVLAALETAKPRWSFPATVRSAVWRYFPPCAPTLPTSARVSSPR
jgi:glyoxylase-like metal-dependent hydrolase (beta-lactamase superfamily II)